MRRLPALLLFAFSLTSFLAGAALPELLQRAKEQFRLGSYSDALAALSELDAESQKPGFEKDRAALQPVLAFYRGASYAALGKSAEARGQFEVFLAFQPNATLDPALYSKKVIAAFEETRTSLRRKAEQPEESGSLAMAYRAFPIPRSEREELLGEDWADGAVRVLLSAEERRDFSRLSDAVSRSEFVTNFWKSRDPKSETPENEFREEFEKRVAFADSRFSQDETAGSSTDRGMVFILLGPPTYIGRKPLTTGDDAADPSGLSRFSRSEIAAAGRPTGRDTTTERAARVDRVTGPGAKALEAAENYREVWHYRRELLPKGIPYQQVDFDFVTREGYGKNVLQRDDQPLHTLEVARKALASAAARKEVSR